MKVFEQRIRLAVNKGQQPDINDIKLLLKEIDMKEMEIKKLKRKF
jgi:hypothetical protein